MWSIPHRNPNYISPNHIRLSLTTIEFGFPILPHPIQPLLPLFLPLLLPRPLGIPTSAAIRLTRFVRPIRLIPRPRRIARGLVSFGAVFRVISRGILFAWSRIGEESAGIHRGLITLRLVTLLSLVTLLRLVTLLLLFPCTFSTAEGAISLPELFPFPLPPLPCG
jgi:hypothetical protein